MATETLDIAEAAALLKVDTETVRQLAADGALYGAKIGRAWVFLREDLLEYLRQQTLDQTAKRRKPDHVVEPAEMVGRRRKFKAPPSLP